MANFTKVGISMLNMDDIAEFLHIARGFMLNTEKACDTLKVGGIPAEHIAIADTSKHNSDGSLKVDRETIKNALHLDGQPAEYYATEQEATDIRTDSRNLKDNYNQELAELRDEFYQLRTELIKNGLVNDVKPYAGYYDVFLNGKPKHLSTVLDTSKNDSLGANAQREIHVGDTFFDSVEVGDHLYLLDRNSSMDCVVTIDGKGDDHETLHFSVGTGFDIKKGMVDVYRSHGMNVGGKFAFGEVRNYTVDKNKVMYTGLDDDTYSHPLPIDKDNPGYAYTFRIPKTMQKSYLSSISIMIQAFGAPGTLIAYVIDQQNIEKWNELRKAELEGTVVKDKDDFGQPLPTHTSDLVIAKSQPLTVDPSLGMHIAEFSFYDPTQKTANSYGFTNPNPYPYLPLQDDEEKHRVRYCMIIEPQSQELDKYDAENIGNCFLLELLKQPGDEKYDLQLNNSTYHYDKSKEEPINLENAEINKYDLYYGITLLKAIERTFVPYRTGIYTARFDEPTPITGCRARLMLRVNREGMFHVHDSDQTTSAGNLLDHSTITVDSDGNYTADFSGSINKDIIIGTNICHVEDANNAGSITIEKGFHLNPKDKVYPIGYQVTIKAYYDEWDPVKCTTIEKYSDRFTMPLIDVIPDAFHVEDISSDRLIFETNLYKTKTVTDVNGDSHDEYILRPYNRFELEIYWKSSRESNSAVEIENGNKKYPLTGMIRDLSLSLDRAL